jgi:hypothetical protein
MMPKRTFNRLRYGVSTAALAAAALAAPAAFAATGVGTDTTIYASEGIPSTGQIGILGASAFAPCAPAALPLCYGSPAFTSTASGTAQITFTLSTGTFFTVPTPFIDGAVFTSVTFSGGGVGSNQVIYTVTYPKQGPGSGQLTLGPFQVSGLTGLSTPGVVTYNGQATLATGVPGTTTLNQVSTGGIFTSTLAASARALAAGVNPTPVAAPLAINVAAPANAKAFVQGSNTNAGVADIGEVDIGTANLAQANANSTPGFRFTGGATVTLTGNFVGIGNALLLKATGTGAPAAAGTCPSTFSPPGGSTTGTFSGNTVTFVGVPVPDPAGAGGGVGYFGAFDHHEVCLYATGTSIIDPSGGVTALTGTLGGGVAVVPQTAVVSLAPDTLPTSGILTAGSCPPFPGGPPCPIIFAGALSGYSYNGSVATVMYTQQNAVNPGFIRILNTGPVPVVVTALVQGDQGGTGSFGTASVETALAPFSNDTVSTSSIVTSSGITPGPFGRVSMVLLSPQLGVGFENLEYSPGTNALSQIQ